MHRFIDFFNHPFPEEKDYKSYLFKIGLISLFIAIFLFTFRPFGLNQVESGLPIICLGFGVITFVASLIYDFISKKIFDFQPCGPGYTLGIWIIHTMGLILIIGIFNYLFLGKIFELPIGGIGELILATFKVGILPIVFIGAIAVVQGEKKYQKIAKDVSNNFASNSSRIRLLYDIPTNQISYVEALQNYVRIWYIQDDQLHNRTERDTLTSIEKDVEGTSLKRCHRSYIANMEEISETSGNAQGLQLTLHNVPDKIPVSRKYVALFR